MSVIATGNGALVLLALSVVFDTTDHNVVFNKITMIFVSKDYPCSDSTCQTSIIVCQ